MKTLSSGFTGKFRVHLVTNLIILVLLLSGVYGCAFFGNIASGNLLTQNLSEPLGGTTIAKVDIDNGSGNLTIDSLNSGEQILVSGTLQYFENQGLPTHILNSSNDQATLTLKAADIGLLCNSAIEWQIHLNPTVTSDITAHSDGGNVNLNLAGMVVTRISADTGGGNMDVILPEDAANFSMTAKTGAGNVVVRVPSGMVARIHATSGLGNVIVDSQFTKMDGSTYQSPDYDSAAHKAEITVSSGAGNVSVKIY